LQRGGLQRLLALKNNIKRKWEIHEEKLKNNANEEAYNQKEKECEEQIFKIIDETICNLYPEEIVKHYDFGDINKRIDEYKKELSE